MKFIESLASIIFGFTIAWLILSMPKVSNFTLNPAPIDYDDSNLMLVGTGLATQMPKPSVMDADMGPAPSVVLMNNTPPTPMSPTPLMISPGTAPAPVTVVNPPTAMAPVAPGMASPAMPPLVLPPPMAPPVATSFTPMTAPSPAV